MGNSKDKDDKSMKKETREEMTARLCAKCIKSGQDAAEARKEVWDMAKAAKQDYMDVISGFRDAIKAELNSRADRWGEISAQKDELLEKEAAAETRLGDALLSGDESAARAEEKALEAIHKDLERIEARLRIFENATFRKSGQTVLEKAEEKLRAYQLVLADCNMIMSAVHSTVQEHVRGFKETSAKYSPDYYPVHLESAPEFLVPEKYSMESLKHLVNDELTIEEIQNL